MNRNLTFVVVVAILYGINNCHIIIINNCHEMHGQPEHANGSATANNDA